MITTVSVMKNLSWRAKGAMCATQTGLHTSRVPPPLVAVNSGRYIANYNLEYILLSWILGRHINSVVSNNSWWLSVFYNQTGCRIVEAKSLKY